MVHDIHKCGARGTRSRLKWYGGPVELHNLWFIWRLHVRRFSWRCPWGLPAGCGVVSAVSMGGRCTGLPGRPCGRHKMAEYLLSAADVKWLRMEMFLWAGLSRRRKYVALGCDLSRKKRGDIPRIRELSWVACSLASVFRLVELWCAMTFESLAISWVFIHLVSKYTSE